MTKHEKELQRYFVQWILSILCVASTISGIIGYFAQFENQLPIYIIMGFSFFALLTFFGFHVTTKVSADGIEMEAKDG